MEVDVINNPSNQSWHERQWMCSQSPVTRGGDIVCAVLWGACITSWDSWLHLHFINQKEGLLLEYKACMQIFTTRMNYLT